MDPDIERLAKELASRDFQCGDCPCPKDFGGDGICKSIHYWAKIALQEAYEIGYADAANDGAGRK